METRTGLGLKDVVVATMMRIRKDQESLFRVIHETLSVFASRCAGVIVTDRGSHDPFRELISKITGVTLLCVPPDSNLFWQIAHSLNFAAFTGSNKPVLYCEPDKLGFAQGEFLESMISSIAPGVSMVLAGRGTERNEMWPGFPPVQEEMEKHVNGFNGASALSGRESSCLERSDVWAETDAGRNRPNDCSGSASRNL